MMYLFAFTETQAFDVRPNENQRRKDFGLAVSTPPDQAISQICAAG